MRICRRRWRHNRALITLDLDFANIRSYPPARYAGIIVLRLGTQAHRAVAAAMAAAIRLLQREELIGRLWIVEADRIRIHD